MINKKLYLLLSCTFFVQSCFAMSPIENEPDKHPRVPHKATQTLDNSEDSSQTIVNVSNLDFLYGLCFITYCNYVKKKCENRMYEVETESIDLMAERFKAMHKLLDVFYPPLQKLAYNLYPHIENTGKWIYRRFYITMYDKEIQKTNQEISLCKQYIEGWGELKRNHWWMMDFGKKYQPVKEALEYLEYMESLPIEERAKPTPDRYKNVSKLINNKGNHKNYKNTNFLDDLPRTWAKIRFLGEFPPRHMIERIK